MNVGQSQGSVQGLLNGKRDMVAGTCALSCPTLRHPLDEAHQAPLCLGFPRQKYWNGLHFLLQGIFPDSGIKPVFPALADGFFTTEPPGMPPGWNME